MMRLIPWMPALGAVVGVVTVFGAVTSGELDLAIFSGIVGAGLFVFCWLHIVWEVSRRRALSRSAGRAEGEPPCYFRR